MHGYLSTERKAGLWNSLAGAGELRMLVACGAVGVLSGLLAGHVRLHLGLSGHKALLWMTPVIFARLVSRSRAGTTVGAFAAAATALGVGGHIAGGFWGLPLVVLAGAVVDVVIGCIERVQLPCLLAIPIIAVAASAANLLCFVKRLLMPPGVGHAINAAWWHKPVSYAFFGLLAGLIAATAACIAGKARKSP